MFALGRILEINLCHVYLGHKYLYIQPSLHQEEEKTEI